MMYYFLKRKKSGTATNKKIPATARGRDRERLAPDLQHPQFAERSQPADSNKNIRHHSDRLVVIGKLRQLTGSCYTESYKRYCPNKP